MQRLRYEVYCLEQRFVDAARCMDGRESDEHDLHSIHFAAATDRGEVVATARLALDSPLRLPPRAIRARAARRSAPRGASAHRRGLAPHHRSALSPGHHPGALILFELFRHLYEKAGGWAWTIWWPPWREPGQAPPAAGIPLCAPREAHRLFRQATLYGAPLAAMRPGYRRILAFQRSSVGGERPSFLLLPRELGISFGRADRRAPRPGRGGGALAPYGAHRKCRVLP